MDTDGGRMNSHLMKSSDMWKNNWRKENRKSGNER